MNELSIQSVLAHKEQYNLALPFMETRQVSPLYRVTVKQVVIDTAESAGQVFKVGSKKEGNGWTDVYALSKTAVQKLGTEAGIQFMPPNPGDIIRIDDNTWQATAYGAIKLPDGSVSSTGDSKVILLDAEEKKYRRQYEKKAEEGITDYKQAQEAAKQYKGVWVDTGEVDRNGYPVKKFVVDPSQRKAYIEGSLSEAMALLRVNAPQKAMTGAKLRVIKSLLAMKSTYTMQELKRPFVIATASFSPDYSDPMVKQFMLQQAAHSAVNLFGAATPAPQIAVTSTPIQATMDDYEDLPEDVVIDQEIEYREPERQPEHVQEPIQQTVQVPQEPAAPAQEAPMCCEKCGTDINQKVYDFSVKKFGRPLCFKCQRS